MSPLADLIVKSAQSYAGKIYYNGNGTVTGIETLLEIYKTTGAGGSSALFMGGWSPIIEKGVRAGMWIRKKPKQTPGAPNVESVDKYCTSVESDGTVAWCGIFATFVVKKAGFEAHWANQAINCSHYVRWGDGITGTPTDYKTMVERGDICVLDTQPGARNIHYIIVIDVDKSTGSMETVEGNLSVPRQSVQALSGKRKVKDIYMLYKLAKRYDPTTI